MVKKIIIRGLHAHKLVLLQVGSSGVRPPVFRVLPFTQLGSRANSFCKGSGSPSVRQGLPGSPLPGLFRVMDKNC